MTKLKIIVKKKCIRCSVIFKFRAKEERIQNKLKVKPWMGKFEDDNNIELQRPSERKLNE
jgi:hypothetical protein